MASVNPTFKAMERYAFGWTDPLGTMGKGSSPQPITSPELREDYGLLLEKNTMLNATEANQANRILTLRAAVKFFASIEGDNGAYARKMLEKDKDE